MPRNVVMGALCVWLEVVRADDSWCRATPQVGFPEYARCLPLDQAVARYVIQVAPLVAFGLEVKYDRSQTSQHPRYPLIALEATLK